jgi:hypothetical protein
MRIEPRFKQSKIDPTLLFIYSSKLVVLLQVHVDDHVLCCNDDAWAEVFKKEYSDKFAMTDLGQLTNFCGMTVEWGEGTVSITQSRQVADLLVQYDMEECKGQKTPMEKGLNLPKAVQVDNSIPYLNLIGSLLWLSRCSRPDITFAVTYLATFSHFHDNSHWGALKRILRYLKQTISYKLVFSIKDESSVLETFSDSDWASDKTDRKSFGGHTVFLYGNLVAWLTKKQPVVALSSNEAEYIATVEAGKSSLYFYNLLHEIGLGPLGPVALNLDNLGAKALSGNAVNNTRTKHIDLRFHWIRDWVSKKVFSLFFVPTDENVADLLTKALSADKTFKFAKIILGSPS